jgi:hypothetical protein
LQATKQPPGGVGGGPARGFEGSGGRNSPHAGYPRRGGLESSGPDQRGAKGNITTHTCQFPAKPTIQLWQPDAFERPFAAFVLVVLPYHFFGTNEYSIVPQAKEEVELQCETLQGEYDELELKWTKMEVVFTSCVKKYRYIQIFKFLVWVFRFVHI